MHDSTIDSAKQPKSRFYLHHNGIPRSGFAIGILSVVADILRSMEFSLCPVLGSVPSPRANTRDSENTYDDELNPTTSSLESLLLMESGPATMAVLSAIDLRGLNEDDRLIVIEAWRRQEGWVSAASQAAIVAAAQPVGHRAEDEAWQRELVALSLRLPIGTAEDRIEIARVLTTKLPKTLASLGIGDISYWHAHALAEACADLDEATASAIETRILQRAATQTTAGFRRSLGRALARYAPDVVAAAHEAAAKKRHVRFSSENDAMATVSATMNAADAQTVYYAIDILAHMARDEARDAELPGGLVNEQGIDAWRADVLVEWARSVLANPALPKMHGRPIRLQLVIDLPTALGLTENPAELVGYGAIPAAVGREWAADAEWQRFIVDPNDGHLLDVGRETYRPSQQLRDFLIARDRRCRFPGCTRSAARCDIDHAIPDGAGGQTTRANCGCLCRRHHLMKTFGDWQLESFPDGSCIWTAPGGRRFPVPAQRFLDTG